MLCLDRVISSHARAVRLACAVAASIALFSHTNAQAAPNDSAPAVSNASVLRICAAAEELPFSRRDGSGFENKIAAAVAETMGRQAQFVWFAKPSIYIVRDQLEIRACDLVMGIDAGDERLATTEPYYRAPYVFIQRVDSPLEISSWKSKDLLNAEKIGFLPFSPAQTMMEVAGIFRENFNYMHSLTNFQSRRNKFQRIPPERMVNEVADGTAALAVHFAPEVARYVKANSKLKMIVIHDDNVRADGEKVPQHFDQSIGVRKDDQELVIALDLALEKARPRIEQILKDEGIPLLPPLSKSSGLKSKIE